MFFHSFKNAIISLTQVPQARPPHPMPKMGEDTLTFTRTVTGYDVEGITKDMVRVVGALEYRCRTEE